MYYDHSEVAVSLHVPVYLSPLCMPARLSIRLPVYPPVWLLVSLSAFLCLCAGWT